MDYIWLPGLPEYSTKNVSSDIKANEDLSVVQGGIEIMDGTGPGFHCARTYKLYFDLARQDVFF